MKKLFLISALIIGAITNGFAQSQPDSLIKKSPNIQIRAIKNPIYVIDGVKQEASEFTIASVKTDSIAEIKIFKNDDAVKLFGPDAVDGVILITTKSGKNNAANLDLAQKLSLMSEGKGVSKLTNLKIYGNAPAGKASAISADNKPKIIIRGLEQQSSTNFNDVVYILDGQKIEKTAVSWINPDTIQSITVLKNDSAIAQYGPQASNGVVIITSKPVKRPKDTDRPVDKN
ncbi:TonB-dependent receptor plug domain-containing protein [Pedobacter rhodius]|uniref:TonB-dependent receptor plug domain-containing protein n=1 Tax=Pedobacter rhodius TaxID=3004098 RepID=A0ABT4KXP2_9SPHI|nr:TonB-dependent receptor plug domain-containing protein [Pedobacter sp. SJ11]MCZ4223703.1 TonB-dependent receptor plug domain-containing protein [Pedobacter sp. SJ11]